MLVPCTNVPVKDSKATILNLFEKNLNKKTLMPVDKSIELIEFDLTTSGVILNSILVSQTRGVAMSKPSFSVIVEIFVQEKNMPPNTDL